ncbi:MAG TPA: efflux RND transporter permease subunit [Phenylobacterium sp.]|jgi:multidrug efflux pump subunit AcrB|uniref:efflux RND transporter permease subunit n=1 Tax=Phenylobacterium sp. TaxID=1871053 RepID=UPI002CF21C50|nr:efflux RND transporter permease subunit [Phenylobacterium sp.]HXA37377.1 efflux RND transporter permease subunit [Phenylobacterium sp.]
MVGIVRLALRRPYTFIVMGLLILIFGVISIFRTPTDIFPNINIPVVSVVFSYTGLSPDNMAGRIVTYYERAATTSVNNIEHLESQSMANYGIVKIFFQPSVNISEALAQIAAMSQTVLKQMPAGITPPIVLRYDASSVPILQVALSSDQLSQAALFDQAGSFIRPQLVSVPGAAIPLPYGGMVPQVQADLNQQALHSYGLSANDVVNALAAQNLITPVGTQKIGTFDYTVNLNNSPETIDAFNDLPVKTVNGAVIYMRDVAFVHSGSPPQTNVVHVDGQNAVLLSIIKGGATSTLNIISGIKARLPDVEKTLPASLKLTAVGDQSGFVISAVSDVVREALIAAALTATMILLFLGSWRSTLIITVSIPLAILSSVTVLSLLGETINVMTLGGLALAVGILVDDATVTIENVNRHLDLGQDIESAIVTGAHEIMIPATVSLTCICIAFVPMFALGGIAGYLFRPLAEAVIFALIASYVLTYTLVPTLANRLLRRAAPEGGAGEDGAPAAQASRNPLVRFQQGFEHRFESVRQHYRGLLHLSLQNRKALIGGFLAVSLLSLGLVPLLGQDFFPTVDGGQIKLHVRAQTGTRIEDTTKLCDQIGLAIGKIIPRDQLAGVVDNIGVSVSGINMAYNNSGTIGPADADILISLTPKHGPTAGYVQQMRERLPALFPGVTFSFLPADMVSQILNFGVPAPIDVQVVGNNLQANRKYANELLSRISRIPGVADPRIEQAFQQPTLNVNVDRSLAGLVSLTERDASTAMLDTLAGSTQTNPTFWLNPKNGVSYPVAIQTPQTQIDTLGALQNIPLTAGGGPGAGSQLLGGLATIQRAPSDALVSHYNVRPVIDIYATPQGRDLGGIAADIRAAIKATAGDAPHGASVVLRGQVQTMSSAYAQLIAGLALAIVLIYFLIVVNFQSWLDPFVIITALPTALAGIAWMLFTTGTTLSVPALTGAIMCMGVATANSILVIAFARERMAEGVDAVTAAMEAGSTRFRPVIMTALAMIIGMIPMAVLPGQNAPLGRAVIGGLLFATCATLVFVPTMFSFVHARAPKRSAGAPNPSPIPAGA